MTKISLLYRQTSELAVSRKAWRSQVQPVLGFKAIHRQEEVRRRTVSVVTSIILSYMFYQVTTDFLIRTPPPDRDCKIVNIFDILTVLSAQKLKTLPLHSCLWWVHIVRQSILIKLIFSRRKRIFFTEIYLLICITR